MIISPEPGGPSHLLWKMTIGELVDKVVLYNPEKVYLHFKNHRVTYLEFREHCLRAAHLFQDLGVKHGDRVCLFLPNGPEFLYSWMGLSRLGAICVPVNTSFKQNEMAYVLNNSEANILVSHHSLLEVAQAAAKQCPSLKEKLIIGQSEEVHDADKGDGLDQPRSKGINVGNDTRTQGWRDFWSLLNETSPLPPGAHPAVRPEDISMLVYTSGTTGDPKGVIITHEMYVAAGQGFADWTGSSSEDRFFTCLPYFHANAQYYSTMGSLAAGASLVLVDRFSASRFWGQVRDSGATVVNFIGMMMHVLLKQPPSPDDRDHSARIFYGSPALSTELLVQFEERFGADVLIGFGLTETCYGAIESIGQPHRRGSSGRARSHPDPRFRKELRIVEDGNPVSTGSVGEIILRNPAVTPGYWRDPERTREALRDGWLYTGDLGRLDEDGHLYFVDRKKDVVRRRGENISSQEVEDVIKLHPGVVDCAVIAVPAEMGEEEVKAYIVPRASQGSGPDAAGESGDLSPEDVVYWCAERMANFKVPRYVEFRDDLPRTPSFRVRKDLLRLEREDQTTGCFDREQAGIRLK